MSRLALKPVQRSHKPAIKADARKAARRPIEAARKPAYMQTKMAVSQPGDAQERQADQVASEVSRAPRADLQRASLEPGITPEKKDESLAPSLFAKPGPSAARIARMATGEEATLQSRLQRQESEQEEPVQTRLMRQTADDTTLQSRLARQASDAESQTAEQDKAGQTLDQETEARIAALQGQGDVLQESVRQDIETQFGRDLANVHIHTDTAAAELCAQVGARAFTVGSDIFFAPGEYAPETEAGRELLAHEMTHVVQQSGDIRTLCRSVSPAPSPLPESGTPAAAAYARLSVLELPPIKHRHAALYSGAGATRAAGYERNTSRAQTSVWNSGVQLTEERIEEKLRAQDPAFTRPSSPNSPVNFAAGSGRVLSTRWRSLRRRLLIPDWDRQGHVLETREEKFQVDHMVELQVFGDTTGDAGNVIGNLELLKGSPNASSGSTIMNAIYSNVATWLGASDPAFNELDREGKQAARSHWLDTHSITFSTISRGSGEGGSDADWWTLAEIEAAAPLDAVHPAPPTRLEGSPGTFVLASGAGGVEIGRYAYTSLQFEPATEVLRKAMAGINIQQFNLNSAMEAGNAGDNAGSLTGAWNLPNGFRGGESVTIPLVSVGAYCAAPGEIPNLNAEFEHLSPLSLADIEVRDGQLYGEGEIETSLPLLSGHPIHIVLAGDDLSFEIVYSSGMVTLPIPGITIDNCSISLFYSTLDGFGGSGAVDFSVPQLGSGNLEVAVTQAAGFSAAGGFQFDSELFDQADIEVWYRNRAFGGEGVLSIDSPDKIRGIRSAQLTVGFDAGAFSANGSIQPNIPGVQEAGLNVAYSEEEGLTIGGNLQLAANPAIRSGSVEVSLNKQDNVWRVSASGSAQPALPGIDSELAVNYDDGAFTAEFSGGFERGMLSGNVTVGVTNRSVGDDGQPTGEPAPNAPLIVYGEGSATVRIAPWLQGTAGVRFAPNGEVTVSGEIGLPSQIEFFPRRQIERDIFGIDIPIPIVPGIFAEIGGGLSAHAGIGPGVIDELRLGIEYNPAHEENTHVTGDGHVNVPADAGLRLAVHGGIGLGIPAASVSGGLEVGGELGIEGAAEAGVHVDWMPSQGLDIEAYGRLSAQPKFVFDISGYVEVEALFFTIYEQRWQLASFEYGSDMTFGVTFPIHYHEGEPFEISLDDVEFETPQISVSDLLGGLFERIV